MTVGGGDCHTQHTLHGHGVAAVAPVMEEATSTLPLTLIKGSGMDIVFALKCCLKAIELYPLGFFRIALGFCDFADHT